jgi:hypothetical protein
MLPRSQGGGCAYPEVGRTSGRRRAEGQAVNQPKRPRDPNQIAKSIIDIATGQKPGRDSTPENHGKDPAAVERGKKGGKARADSLTAQKRSEIAKAAARTRWRFRQDQEN